MEPHENLTAAQVRNLLRILAAKSVTTVMNNHYFQIGGRLNRQTDGAAIGLDLDVEYCSLYMTKWDAVFLRKLM